MHDPHFAQGYRECVLGHPRELNPFKGPTTGPAWLAGWDAAHAELEAKAKQAAQPHWRELTSRGELGSSWYLAGEAPEIHVWLSSDQVWCFDCPTWGIQDHGMDLPIDTAPETARRGALLAIRQILAERLTEFDALANPTTGALLPKD